MILNCKSCMRSVLSSSENKWLFDLKCLVIVKVHVMKLVVTGFYLRCLISMCPALNPPREGHVKGDLFL